METSNDMPAMVRTENSIRKDKKQNATQAFSYFLFIDVMKCDQLKKKTYEIGKVRWTTFMIHKLDANKAIIDQGGMHEIKVLVSF